MNNQESVALARVIQAHWPHQPIDKLSDQALMQTCGQYTYADLRAAVLAIAERGEHWCAPTDVKAEVKRIRARRIDAAGPLTPPADLTEAEQRAWLGQARRQLGDGIPADRVTAALAAGPRRDVRELGQAGVGVDQTAERSAAREAIAAARERAAASGPARRGVRELSTAAVARMRAAVARHDRDGEQDTTPEAVSAGHTGEQETSA